METPSGWQCNETGYLGTVASCTEDHWVAVQGLKLSYHNGYIYIHIVINRVSLI